MKKYVVGIAMISLLSTGAILVYLEASAIPLLCDVVSDRCGFACLGEFSIDYCWEGENHISCYFWCYFNPSNCTWWTQSPVYELCIY